MIRCQAYTAAVQIQNMDTMIRVQGLKRYFGNVKAVDDISLEVERGELFGFLGINGAGKSTTINMLCTLYPPTAGQIEVCGYTAGKDDGEIRKRIGVVYQNNCLDDKLTVKENLFVRGVLYEKNHRKLASGIERICDLLELTDVFNRRFAKLSGGQKRRCEIARALVNTPELMFLDEPTTGLDPATRQKVWACLEQLRREDNMTIFLTTHYMEEAARASHIAIIDAGRIQEYGTPFALKEQYAKDQLKLYPPASEEASCALRERLSAMQVTFREKDSVFVIPVSDSLAALPILRETEGLFGGFEMVQGSMDDVFLNVTGKELEG